MEPTAAMTGPGIGNPGGTLHNIVDFDSSQSTDMYSCVDHLMMPLFGNHVQDNETAAIWQVPLDYGSPLTESVPADVPTPGLLGRSGGITTPEIVIDRSEQNLEFLQQPCLGINKIRKYEERSAPRKIHLIKEGFKVCHVKRHTCKYSECKGKSYARKEHLKRHYNE
jgi:hypothetical protein